MPDPSSTDFAFVYDPALSEYELSDSHPFKPVRLELTRSLLEHAGTLSPTHVVKPKPVTEAKLLRIHHRDFVEAVKAVSRGEEVDDAYSYGLGTGDNPIFPHMHEAILRVCSATVTAVDLVASGKVRRALNLSGGLHHAHAGQASGFCLYNDLALGIDHAVNKYGLRVAYLDIDAHHGDGVQGLFYEHPEVMTISLHESGRYLFPGSGYTYEVGKGAGRGRSVNLPLEPYTEDASYLASFEAVVPAALRVFRPDLIVLQAGADMHAFDPLGRPQTERGGHGAELPARGGTCRRTVRGPHRGDRRRRLRPLPHRAPRLGAPLGDADRANLAREVAGGLARAVDSVKPRPTSHDPSRRHHKLDPDAAPRRHQLAQRGGRQAVAEYLGTHLG